VTRNDDDDNNNNNNNKIIHFVGCINSQMANNRSNIKNKYSQNNFKQIVIKIRILNYAKQSEINEKEATKKENAFSKCSRVTKYLLNMSTYLHMICATDAHPAERQPLREESANKEKCLKFRDTEHLKIRQITVLSKEGQHFHPL
jgi:hypothetical protein